MDKDFLCTAKRATYHPFILFVYFIYLLGAKESIMADRDLVVICITYILLLCSRFSLLRNKTVKTDPKLFLSEKPWVSAEPNNRVVAVVRRKPLARASRVIHARCHWNLSEQSLLINTYIFMNCPSVEMVVVSWHRCGKIRQHSAVWLWNTFQPLDCFKARILVSVFLIHSW